MRPAGSLEPTAMPRRVHHAFVWEKGVFTTLDPARLDRSQGGFLNAQGEVVGGYRDGTSHHCRKTSWLHLEQGRLHHILTRRRRTRALGPVAFGINDLGTGSRDLRGYRAMSATMVSCVSKGVYTTVRRARRGLTVAEGINNAGTIVGLYVDDEGFHGFVRSRKGDFTTIDAPERERRYRDPLDQRERRNRGILCRCRGRSARLSRDPGPLASLYKEESAKFRGQNAIGWSDERSDTCSICKASDCSQRS